MIDTTILVDVSKRAGSARTRLRDAALAGDVPGVCPIVVCEFESGLLPADRPEWELLLQGLQFWHISREAAQHAGQERFAFARRGIQISAADALIAAVAREVGAVLVTDNVRDFPQPDLQVVSWRT